MSASPLRTPLGRARGLGSAKSGVTDWLAQRISAVALAPLSAWFVFSVAVALDGGHADAVAWLAQPVNATLLALLVIAAFYHMGAGMRVIVEDYISKPATKAALLLGNVFLWFGLAAASLLAIVRISLGS